MVASAGSSARAAAPELTMGRSNRAAGHVLHGNRDLRRGTRGAWSAAPPAQFFLEAVQRVGGGG